MSKLKSKDQKPLPKMKAQKIESTEFLPKKYETWICIGIILVSLLVFYKDVVFQNKVFLSHDNVTAGYGSGKVEQDVFPLWTPYVFSGMPSYGSLMTSGDRWFDLSVLISKRIMLYIGVGGYLLLNGWLIFYYFIFGLSLFLLMVHKGHNKIVATFTALAIIFCTTVVSWAFDGHNTKVMAAAYFPFILLLVDKLREKMNWLYVALLAVAVHLELESTHLQMFYYFYLFLGFYLLYSIIRSLKNKEQLMRFIRSAALLALTTGLAFAMSADRYISTYEYSKYSIRGASPLVTDSKAKAETGEGGSLDYDYATSWSFSPGEVMTFFIPSYYGFGSIDNYNGRIPFRQNGITANTYFGQMTFTNSPNYFGALILILSIIGFLYYRKDIFVQSIAIIGILALFISFGRELPVLYDLMFNYFPYFNKFRVPVMILILVEISAVILAGYGLSAVIDIYKKKSDEKNLKRLLYGAITFGAIFLLSLVGKGLISDIYRGVFDSAIKTNTHQSLSMAITQNPGIADGEFAVVFGNMMKDLYFSLVIGAMFFGLAYLFVKKTLSPKVFYAALILILVVDLWRVDNKPFEAKPKRELENEFKKPGYIEFLEKDKTPYRALEWGERGPNYSNQLASFNIQNVYGYSAAKLRIYQDVIETCFTPFLWNMLNTKYIISNNFYNEPGWVPAFDGGQNGQKIMENKNCLPRAFFVNRFEVKSKIEIVNKIKEGSFNPKEVAYLESDPGVKVDSVLPAAEAKVSKFGSHQIEFDVNATGNNLLFISEIYYPAGWKAYIDGKETSIYKTNYIFRSIVVPQGTHKVEMKFDPESFRFGRQVSLFSNIIVIGVLGFFAASYFIKRRKKPENKQTEKTI